MQRFNKVVALLLCVVMLIGFVPVSALAADGAGTVVDAAIIFSDLHTSKSDYKESTLKGILNGIRNAGVNPSSVTSAGDAFSVNEDYGKYTGYTSTLTGYIRDVFPGVPVNYVWSDHDRYALQEDDSTLLSNDSGFVYGAGADGLYGTDDDGNYYIYSLSMADLSTNNRYNADFHTDAEVTAAIADFTAAVEELHKDRPLFIASHQPLLDRRNDNGHAYEWATAINAAAEKMDVAYFFGHNHKYDVAQDYYYGKGETMSVCSDSSGNAKNVTLNFTHMCAGYMAPSSTGSTSNTTRQGVAVAITIYDDAIQYTTYDKNGVYSGSYALNETVTREFAAKNEPVETEPTEPEAEPVEDAVTGITVAAPGVTNVTVEVLEPEYATEVYTAYASFDIVLEGYAQGTEATVCVPAPASFDANKPVLVLYAGEVIDTTAIVDGKVTFTTDHFSTYDLAQTAAEDTADLEWVVIYEVEGGSYYELAKSVESGETYLIASAASGSSVRLLKKDGSCSNSVTVSNGRITSGGADYEWMFQSSGNGYTIQDTDGDYLYPNASYNKKRWSYSIQTGASSPQTVSVDMDNSGLTDISRSVTSGSQNTTSHLRYEKNSFSANTSSRSIYLFKKAARDAVVVYGAMSGDADYTYYVGEFDSNEDLLAVLKEGIRVYTAADENGTNAAEDLSYTISGNVNCAAVGTYTLTVSTAEGYKVGEITVNILAEPYLQITENDRVVTAPIMRKNVKVGDTIQLGVQAFDGSSVVDEPANVTWHIVEGYEDMAEVSKNGLVTCLKAHGTIWVEAEWVLVEGDTTVTMTDMVLISVTDDNFFTPADGTNDFPEFPDKGSIRFDKTAEGVGNFSNTGIAKVELSMTGVPFATPETLDVVLMLDRSSSMYKSGVQHRISSTIAATKTFIENIVMNDDGTFNNNRIMVMDFLGGNLDSSAGGGSSHQYQSNLYTTKEESGYQIIGSQEELDDLFDTIDRGFVGQTSLYGTEYARGLEDCYNALAASRADGNKQFCVFMSDGIPNYMMGETTHFKKTNDIVARFDVTNRTAANGTATRGGNYEYEYYSTQMKNEGVTVYTVGLGLLNTNSAWSGTSKEVCEQVANMLLNDISGPAGETAAQRDTGNAVSKLDQYFFSVADDNAAENMKDVFGNIASSISEAASNVVVTDKIDPHYNVIFDVPKGTREITSLPEGQQFYIEVVDYPLNEYHDRITASAKSVFKLCLKDSNGAAAGGTYSAVDGEGNAYAAPVFRAAAEGQKAYWSIVESSYEVQPNDIVIEIDGSCYKFMELGDGTHNVASGAYAYGSINEDNMSTDLVLITPYFAYSAETRMLAWTAEKLSADRELALSYFVYLIDSATEVGVDGVEVAPGPYPTNDWAYITYTNFNGNDCRQEFPVPQLTWNGAQVSYVFYLVNEKGEPINKSGQVVDFANAVFVTDVFTEHVIWNKEGTEGASELNIQYLAKDKLSEAYTLYDENAEYAVHVFQEEDGTNKFNYFIINGSAEGTVMGDHSVLSDDTTKVYNTKAGERYTEYGTYSDKPVGTTFNTLDAGGNQITITTTHQANLDYADTTVAFAVLWMPRLAPDVVVVDYGLDVLINVVMNDSLQNTISGISQYVTGTAVQDTGVYVTAKMGMENLNIDGNTISIENENQVRFHQGDMEFDQKVKFYYESPVSFTENGNTRTGYMYSSVTVIPATTIYYEDDFVTLKSYSIDGTEINSTWENPEDSKAVQAQDRPGASLISGSIDADNNYGYDGAYTNMSQLSLGSSAKITVDEKTYGTAEFSFYGTGFDVISLTSYQTGNIVVNVTGGPQKIDDYYFVDTFYGYARGDLLLNTYTYVDGNWKLTGSEKVENAESVSANRIGAPVFPEDTTETVTAYEYEWIVVESNDPNALYQVPVMKIEELPYGKYNVTITASYVSDFDHVENSSSYDFYLDAIRIYDPAHDGANDVEIRDAYKADGEYLPEYYELRNWLIDADTFAALGGSEEIDGIVFIDGAISDGTTIGAGPTASVTDYSNYGPNNELYLAPGQAVAFNLNAAQDAPEGYEVDTVQIAYKSVDGTAKVKLWDAASDTVSTADEKIVATATDLYYDITALNGKTVVILNSGTTANDAILSITNVKVTFKEAADAASEPQAVSNFSMLRSVSTYALTAAAEPAEETGTITAPFTVTTCGVASAIAAMTAEEPEEPTVPSEPEEPTVPSEPEEPTEPEVFDPMVFKVKLNKDKIKVGQNVKVTVTTSSDVEYVIINGEVVDHCTVDWRGVCTWTLQLVGRQVGPVNVEVICCNADDVASDPVTVHFNVRRK